MIRAHDYTRYLRATEDYYMNVTYTENCTLDKMADIIEVSKKRSSFLTKYFKKKGQFQIDVCIPLVPLVPLVIRLLADQFLGQTDRHTDTQTDYSSPRACAPRVNNAHRAI